MQSNLLGVEDIAPCKDLFRMKTNCYRVISDCMEYQVYVDQGVNDGVTEICLDYELTLVIICVTGWDSKQRFWYLC